MHMDLANFTIQKMRPYIRRQAGEYERDKFDALLEVQKSKTAFTWRAFSYPRPPLVKTFKR